MGFALYTVKIRRFRLACYLSRLRNQQHAFLRSTATCALNTLDALLPCPDLPGPASLVPSVAGAVALLEAQQQVAPLAAARTALLADLEGSGDAVTVWCGVGHNASLHPCASECHRRECSSIVRARYSLGLISIFGCLSSIIRC
jgi:hypothetical protein